MVYTFDATLVLSIARHNIARAQKRDSNIERLFRKHPCKIRYLLLDWRMVKINKFTQRFRKVA